jgi:hypothetical protein
MNRRMVPLVYHWLMILIWNTGRYVGSKKENYGKANGTRQQIKDKEPLYGQTAITIEQEL